MVLCTILLTGAPAIVYALHTWGVSNHVDRIQDRQDDVRIRLSVLENEHAQLVQQVRDLEERIRELTRPR